MPALRDTVKSFMAAFPEMRDDDEPLTGSDAVDRLCEFWPDFKRALAEDKKEHALAYELAVALNDAYRGETDRDDEARNVGGPTLTHWKRLLQQSVKIWPRTKEED